MNRKNAKTAMATRTAVDACQRNLCFGLRAGKLPDPTAFGMLAPGFTLRGRSNGVGGLWTLKSCPAVVQWGEPSAAAGVSGRMAPAANMFSISSAESGPWMVLLR